MFCNTARPTAHHRWPWLLFKLLSGQLGRPAEFRQTIARRVLETSIDDLEHNTRKIRILCESDLRHVAHTGKVECGSVLHGVLTTIALHLLVDAGELESLNSMIKSQMLRGNNSNMSLSLLSARVNARKTMAMSAASVSGVSNAGQSLKVIKPIACQLAKSSLLYQDLNREALDDTYRWSPPDPVKITNKRADFFDPSVSQPELMYFELV